MFKFSVLFGYIALGFDRIKVKGENILGNLRIIRKTV